MDIPKRLIAYGLSQNEARTYLACLRLGAATVYRIAEKTVLPKSTAYDTLTSLKHKGLIAYAIKNGVRHFEAAPPAKFLGVLEEKRRRISPIIAQLEAMQESTTEKPTVEIYEGKEGLKTILEDVLKEKQEFHIIGNFGKFAEYFRYFSNLFVKRRIEAGIRCKLLEERSPENLKLRKTDRRELRITKFLDGLEKLNAECYLYGDRIAMLTLLEEQPVGIVIKNRELSKLFKLLFTRLWEKS